MSEPNKKMWYNITFRPDKSNNNLSPDFVTFSQVSQVCITVSDTGELCAIKQRGGQGARYKRYKTRQEWKLTKPTGIEKENNEH